MIGMAVFRLVRPYTEGRDSTAGLSTRLKCLILSIYFSFLSGCCCLRHLDLSSRLGSHSSFKSMSSSFQEEGGLSQGFSPSDMWTRWMSTLYAIHDLVFGEIQGLPPRYKVVHVCFHVVSIDLSRYV